jgi:hypothetical protein
MRLIAAVSRLVGALVLVLATIDSVLDADIN